MMLQQYYQPTNQAAFMLKTFAALALLFAAVTSFDIRRDILQPDSANELSSIPWPYTVCGGDSSWTIESLTLGSTPKRNINDDIVVTGTDKDSVTFKRVEIDVKLNGVFLDKEVAPFTESYDAGDSVEFTYKNFIPSFAPPGTYGLTFSFIDSKDKENGCLQFQFKL